MKGSNLRKLTWSYRLEDMTESRKRMSLIISPAQYEALEEVAGGDLYIEYWKHSKVLRTVLGKTRWILMRKTPPD